MAENKAIRVPRTTALFVHGLARILRDQLELRVTEHEHWTFEQAGEWEECGSPGDCSFHGFSDRRLDEIDEMREQGRTREAYFIETGVPCYQYNINAYVGVGQARIAHKEAELRTVIEEVESSGGLGSLYRVRVWVQIESGEILRGEYGLHFELDAGKTYPTDEPIPDYPPNRIAFWKEEEAEAELAYSS